MIRILLGLLCMSIAVFIWLAADVYRHDDEPVATDAREYGPWDHYNLTRKDYQEIEDAYALRRTMKGSV